MPAYLGIHDVVSVSTTTTRSEAGYTWTSLIVLTDKGEKIHVTLYHGAAPLNVQIQASEALRVELT